MTGSVFALAQRTLRANDTVDAMPPELRACVHEFGFAIVNAFVAAGLKKPSTIRHLVKECWDGARQPNQTSTDKGRGHLTALDWLLVQSGSAISAATLVRVLHDHGFVVLPREPTTQMLVASMATVSNFDVRATKEEKHRLRLRAAVEAARKQFWPHLVSKGN